MISAVYVQECDGEVYVTIYNEETYKLMRSYLDESSINITVSPNEFHVQAYLKR